MNLLGSTEKKVTNDKNVQHLDFNVVPLNHFNAANNDYQQDSCFFCMRLLQISHFVNY